VRQINCNVIGSILSRKISRKAIITYEVGIINETKGIVSRRDGDLLTSNFAKFVELVLSNISKSSYIDIEGFYNTEGVYSKLSVGYTAYCWDYAYYSDRKWYIFVGNGSGTPSVDDYNLFSTVARVLVNYLNVSVSDTEAVVEIKASSTASQTFDATELGLALYTYGYAYGSGWERMYILLSHDVLSQAVHIEEGDAFTAFYKFIFTW